MFPSLSALLASAGTSPFVQALAIIIGTFILEDAATIVTAMEVQTGQVSLGVALVALYIGIVVGDLGLYGLGRLAALWPPARRWVAVPGTGQQGADSQGWFGRNVFRIVFISRFIPGARLPLYTACGFFRASIGRFAGAAILATLIWTSLLFAVSLRIGQFLIDHLGAWKWLGMAGFVLTIILVGRIVATVRSPSR
ncbi:VTT domain-containing protein [Gluconacetobacter azotocaptans]|uniref:DedA family protein n=1 Tax=Gluconacetobacter azotocaptans TaxID=142834 RepID=UPI00195AB70D|nr:VTT domain-containing protein [Gluconacetobacter azotocaptans]MBM9400918.1 VTT domain-containing protein [Gluconacetobacter azotocaptans]